VGKASALPLVQRCHDGRDLSFGDYLKQMTVSFKTILHINHLPKRNFRLGQTERPPVILYSDASESPDYLCLGFVMHDIEDSVSDRYYVVDVCPPWLFHRFAQHGKSTICFLELLTALCALLTMRDSLRNRRVCLYVDNTADWSCMINGYSSSVPMSSMGNLFHLAITALGIDCWVKWVNTQGNLADLPSRPAYQWEQLYSDRPVFKQRAMAFPSLSDYTNPSSLFFRLKSEQPK
jgi:hypothetical protein